MSRKTSPRLRCLNRRAVQRTVGLVLLLQLATAARAIEVATFDRFVAAVASTYNHIYLVGHLDARSTPPSVVNNNTGYTQYTAITRYTQAIRGRCAEPPAEPPFPLVHQLLPQQCMLYVGNVALFVLRDASSSLWLDNVYVAQQPASTSAAVVLEPGKLPSLTASVAASCQLWMTRVFMQGGGGAGAAIWVQDDNGKANLGPGAAYMQDTIITNYHVPSMWPGPVVSIGLLRLVDTTVANNTLTNSSAVLEVRMPNSTTQEYSAIWCQRCKLVSNSAFRRIHCLGAAARFFTDAPQLQRPDRFFANGTAQYATVPDELPSTAQSVFLSPEHEFFTSVLQATGGYDIQVASAMPPSAPAGPATPMPGVPAGAWPGQGSNASAQQDNTTDTFVPIPPTTTVPLWIILLIVGAALLVLIATVAVILLVLKLLCPTLRKRNGTSKDSSVAHLRPNAKAAAQWTTPPTTMTAESSVPKTSRVMDMLQRVEEAFNEFYESGWPLFGKYQVLGAVQRRAGGQGVVQFVVNCETGVEYAVKCYGDKRAFAHEQMLCDVDELKKMMAATAAVYPNDDGRYRSPSGFALPPCIVFEKGQAMDEFAETLERLPDGSLTATAKTIALQAVVFIADRLQQLHRAGWVHRDMKPSNVLRLPSSHSWSLIDFGCTARTGTEARLSFTLVYSAPEVLLAFEAGANSITADESLDMWALGVIAWEILTGKKLSKNTDNGTLYESITGRCPLPWEVPGGTSTILMLGKLEHIILACLDRNPSRRPRAGEVVSAWESIVDNTRPRQR